MTEKRRLIKSAYSNASALSDVLSALKSADVKDRKKAKASRKPLYTRRIEKLTLLLEATAFIKRTVRKLPKRA